MKKYNFDQATFQCKSYITIFNCVLFRVFKKVCVKSLLNELILTHHNTDQQLFFSNMCNVLTVIVLINDNL